MTGRIVSHYEVLEKLGEGGMGVVFKARDLRLERLVALKFLPARLVGSGDQVARFEQEARAISALNHPHIASIHDVGEVEGQRFLVLEYLPGGTLKAKLRQLQAEGERLPAGQALSYSLQIAEALGHAHRRGIVHRDVKTDNAMFTEEGALKITDFGLAKLADSGDLTQTGHTVGTAAYMSPEQAQGLPVDHRSDIFSLGIVVFEMFSGELPFQGKTGMAVLYEIVNAAPPAVSERRSDAPPRLDQILRRMLEKQRERRFQTMEQVMGELRGVAREIERGSTSSQPRAAAASAIAVLPFANVSPDPENEYFSDGLTEDLITALSQIEGLRVVARTSAFQFKGKAHDVREIGRQLSVGTVLEGSVRKAGERVRITAQLVSVADGFQLWSERFDREMRDVFAIQDEISRAIVKALQLKLAAGAPPRLVKHYSGNIEAYNLVLKGRYYWNKWTEEGFRKGMELYSQAIAADPRYAPAYAGLADSFNLLGFWGMSPPKEVMPNAKALAMKALELDETLAEAHTSLGMVRILYDWDWAGAEPEFLRALELNPGEAGARLAYAMTFLAPAGRVKEAIEQMRRARELDPLSLVINTYLGVLYSFARDPDKAIPQLQATLELDPAFAEAHRSLGWAYYLKGRMEDATAAFEKARSLGGNTPFLLADLSWNYAAQGRLAAARDRLRELLELREQTYVSPYCLAIVQLGLGEIDQCFAWLEKAFEERSGWLTWLKTSPAFERLGGHPRLVELQKRVGFPD
jgi:TolB-like protein